MVYKNRSFFYIKQTSLIIAFWVAVSFVIHIWVAKNYDLHRDELLFVALGKHLEWGFASVPPFIGFISYLTQLLFSDLQFGLKFIAAIAGAGLVVVVGKTTIELGGKNEATFLSCVAVSLSPAYMATASLFQPVIFDIFLWTLSAYYFIKLLKTENTNFWYPFIIALAIGFLNKYNIVFEVAGFLSALIISSKRSLFLKKQFWFASIIGLLMVFPNLFWQFQNHFPVVDHMNELQRTQLSHLHISDFFVSQILDNAPAAWLWGFAIFAMILKKEEKWLRPLLVGFIITIALFAFGGAKHYYSFGLYPPLLSIGSFVVEKYWVSIRMKILKVVFALLMILISIFAMPIGVPLFSHQNMVSYFQKIKPIIGESLFTWEDRKVYSLTQDYADETGWKELANIAERAYSSLSMDEKNHAAIYCENYGQAGAIELYAKKIPLVVVSFSDNYLKWAPDSLNISTLIYVNNDPTEIRTHFESVTEFGILTDSFAREKNLPVFICRKPNAEWQNFYSNKTAQLKKVRF